MLSSHAQSKLRIGVSSCLLGYNVRYDGKNKKHDYVTKLCETFDCIAICPEYRIGMGVPRPTINLVTVNGVVHALTSEPVPSDVTLALRQDAVNLVASEKLVGYVFKARSPSCGVNSASMINSDNHTIEGYTSGIFSEKIQQLLPNIPIIEEQNLTDEAELNNFIQRILAFAQAANK